MSNVRALQDVLRFLNLQDFKRDDDTLCQPEHREFPTEQGPLKIAGDAVVADYASLRLSSSFHRIVTGAGEAKGYKAYLRAASNVGRSHALDISRLALAAGERREIVYLDRLTRTLHALNYLAKDLCGDLHMSVNPRHLLEVNGNHGAVFEQILAKCGLETDRIVLEISEYAVSDKAHLQLAIAGWRKRNYKIAFDGFGAGRIPVSRVLKLNPDIIKIDIRSLEANDSPASRKLLEPALDEFYANGLESMATHIESAAHFEIARRYRFTALQGSWMNAFAGANSGQEAAVV